VSKTEVQIVDPNATKFDADEKPIQLGDWYWCKDGEDEDEESEESLCCIISIGSNYVKVEGLSRTSATTSWELRVHMTDFDESLRPCDNATEVIEEYLDEYRSNVKRLLQEVKDVTARLGVSSQTALEKKKQGNNNNNTALTVMSGMMDTKSYENSLVKAAKEELPELFEEIKENNELLAHWMIAETLPLQAQCGSLKDIIESVQDRIFNVKIYAGLVEQVIHFSKGEPADFNAPLHVFEKRLYMDEECLIGYDTGGMDCKNIAGFNRWLRRPENRDRILPYDRCLATFRVRRFKKDYGIPRDYSDALRMQEKHSLNWETYIYIRNGENLYLIGSELDFGDTIFNSVTGMDNSGPLMFRREWKKFEFMPVADYEHWCEEDDKYKILFSQQEAEREIYIQKCPKDPDDEDGNFTDDNYDDLYSAYNEYMDKAPHGGSWHRHGRDIEGGTYFGQRESYELLNHDSVYYDDAMAFMDEETKRYNRLAMIIQGIFDRSEMLHPHPEVKVWQEESFNRSVKLIYDASANLYQGKEPDIDAYMEENRKHFNKDSVFFGQENKWLKDMAAKENSRRDRSYRHDRDQRDLETYEPDGNRGPTTVSRPERWQKKSRSALFSWYRERLIYDRWNREPIRTTCTISEKYLFDLTQYKRNDYKIFLGDPRTREKYLEWSGQLIMGELYLDGKLDVAEPCPKR